MSEIGDRLRGVLSRAAQRQERVTQGPQRTTRADLVSWAQRNLRDRRLMVVSNREPYPHTKHGGEIRWIRNAGGLTVALDSVAQALGAVWIAHGSGDADVETADEHGRVRCPPDAPAYTLRRVWLTPEDQALYYSGLSNGALWPLCHIAYVRPRFLVEEWERYRDVNRRFAEAVLEEMGDQPAFVFLQDYHLALAARTIKEKRPDALVAMFWHIPWPNVEVFRIFPWRQELLEGLLANDLVGFHIRHHAHNFLDSVADTLEARVDRERSAVERGGRRTWVSHFPMGVNASELESLAESAAARESERKIRARFALSGVKVALGVDRLDYTKGIPERLDALERLFEKHPEWVGKLCFIQIAVPSRVELEEYRAVMDRTHERVARINARFLREGGDTVVWLEGGLDFRELVPYYRLADLCAVTSLHDGMNLVAKEYVAATPDSDGALVLSPFTGAARELERAWLASPYDRDGMADVYHQALSESPEARRERMTALREIVLRHNIFDWAIEVFDTVQRLTLRTPQAESADVAQG
jgi:trehalose 6-phosphate synthase